jgi:hypothetical protein
VANARGEVNEALGALGEVHQGGDVAECGGNAVGGEAELLIQLGGRLV